MLGRRGKSDCFLALVVLVVVLPPKIKEVLPVAVQKIRVRF